MGFAIIRPFPRVLLCPRNIPKLQSGMGLVVVWIWASLISVQLFLWVWVWFGEYGQTIDRQTLPLYRRSAVTKNKELLGWDPPRISITDFNIPCHLTEKKHGSFGGRGGSEAKKTVFCSGRHYGKKTQIQQARPLRMLVEWASINLYFIRPSVIWWAQNPNLHPGTLVRPTS